MLVLVPAGIGTLIELWKCKKILKLEITLSGIRVKPNVESKSVQKQENRTKEVDREAMTYLSYVLYPLCICGAVYSLIYQPHKRYTEKSKEQKVRIETKKNLILQLVFLDVKFSRQWCLCFRISIYVAAVIHQLQTEICCCVTMACLYVQR